MPARTAEVRVLVGVFERIVQRAKGRPLRIAPELDDRDVFGVLLAKGLLPALRGGARLPLRALRGRPALLGKGVTLINAHRLHTGRLCYIGQYSYLDCTSTQGVTLGDRVTIREGAWLQLTSHLDNPGLGIRIGRHTYIGPRTVLGAAGWLEIGSHCQIGADVHFIAENHVYEGDAPMHELGVVRRGIRVGDDCWIGNGVRILDGVTIGDGVVIGAGSVVTRDIPSNEVWVGLPARMLKQRQAAGTERKA